MKQSFILVLLFLLSLPCFVACAEDNPRNTPTGDNEEFTIHNIMPAPSNYFEVADHQGTIELLQYKSKDYTGSMAETTKPAYVYLPYGYDPSKKYDIIYLLHGWTGVAQEYFLGRNGNQRTAMVNIFDHMIENGDCRPFIAVSPTWDKDNQAKDWGESTREAAVFSQEYINDLIPAVETHYSTYLTDASLEGIIASRSHRAIGGFSLGAITTWYVFEQAFAYSRMYLPMSGDNWSQGMYGGQYYPEETARFLADLVNASPYGNDFYVWYAVGTNDVRLPQTHNQALAMAALSETFNASNFSYHMKEGGQHDFNAVWEFCYNALPFFFPSGEQQAYYTRETLIQDVINNPAFNGYGRLIFPVNTGYWSGTTLEDLDLAWYNYIDPDKTVEIVNYLKAQALEGNLIFIRFYSEDEMAADPDKRDTGLFFFRGNDNAPFAICNAGGGHVYVGAMHDSFPHALELSKKGYNAFALIYRPDWEPSDEDLARAVAYVYDHAQELGVSPDGYSLWGGSAGARMAADMSRLSHMRSSTGRADIPQAAACIMQYTGYSSVAADYAPTYACCGTADGIASWHTMQNRLQQLTALGIPTEFHAYDGLPHGFGLGTGTVAEGWINDAVAFWMQQATSGVNEIKSDRPNASGIYTLDGRQHNTPQKGINIINGKKIRY